MGWLKDIFGEKIEGQVNSITGAVLVSEEKHKERIDICLKCDKYSNNAAQYCTECYCVVPFKTKLKGTSCPLGKWE